ncbi:complex I NDUFA9 subunit family protein [Rhodoferax mekongensis]|uniref:Complex I NDUFA9 subunit family protein n=1 Tax=Rhodoferax mekongensis TaxID=3068341 RepID=A0ABZ0B0J6_9BURK|nr:complex I NDUFA9 subunit family protein [Rhodoferax sp. TBRC 17307]WNO04519.1 complex I NDUFA9 subunit family protein [Rhodoferax sp. TBRC 17307]
MKNIFVLGGTGFVGRHVVQKLVKQGYTVTVATRRAVNARELQTLPTVTVAELNVHDPLALQQALAGHDAVVNLVAILHGSEAAFQKVHVDLPAKLAHAAVAAGLPHVVHVSALGANPQQPDAAPSRYLRSKSRGELALSHPALAVSVLRPSVIFGAEDKFLNMFAKLQQVFPLMPLAGTHARFQPVWVEDVASAVVRLVQSRAAAGATGVWEACGPQVYTLGALVHGAGVWAGIAEGRGRPVIPLPEWAGRLQAALMQLAPGEPLMSGDNLDSMKVDNVASGIEAGLSELGIQAAALEPIAMDYLQRGRPGHGLLGLRRRT